MAVVNGRSTLETDPIRNFRFLASFIPHEGFTGVGLTDYTIGFTSISGLTISTESIPYREGGYNTAVHQVPGQTSFSPLTFQRGITIGSSGHWEWMRQLFRVIQGTGDTSGFRCDINISVLQHPMALEAASHYGVTPQNDSADKVAMRFRVYNAIMVEQMTCVHEGFDMAWAQKWDTSAPALA